MKLATLVREIRELMPLSLLHHFLDMYGVNEELLLHVTVSNRIRILLPYTIC